MTDERGGRYFREARFFLVGDKAAAQSHILDARSLLGYMRDMHAMGGPPIQVQFATLGDGTRIKATMMNGQYQAEIVAPPLRPGKPAGYTPLLRFLRAVTPVPLAVGNIVCGLGSVSLAPPAWGGSVVNASADLVPSCADGSPFAFMAPDGNWMNLLTASMGDVHIAAVDSYAFFRNSVFKFWSPLFPSSGNYFEPPPGLACGYLWLHLNVGGAARLFAVPAAVLDQVCAEREYRAKASSLGTQPNGLGMWPLIDAVAEPFALDNYATGVNVPSYNRLQYLVQDAVDPLVFHAFVDRVGEDPLIEAYRVIATPTQFLSLLDASPAGLATIDGKTLVPAAAGGVLSVSGSRTYGPDAGYIWYLSSQGSTIEWMGTSWFIYTGRAHGSYTQKLQYSWGREYAADTYVYDNEFEMLTERLLVGGGYTDGNDRTTTTAVGATSRVSEIPLVCDEANQVEAYLRVVYGRLPEHAKTSLWLHPVTITLHVLVSGFALEREIFSRAGEPNVVWDGVFVRCLGDTSTVCTASGDSLPTEMTGGAGYPEMNSHVHNNISPLLQKQFNTNRYGSYIVVGDTAVLNLRTTTRMLQELYGNWSSLDVTKTKTVAAVAGVKKIRDASGAVVGAAWLPDLVQSLNGPADLLGIHTAFFA